MIAFFLGIEEVVGPTMFSSVDMCYVITIMVTRMLVDLTSDMLHYCGVVWTNSYVMDGWLL